MAKFIEVTDRRDGKKVLINIDNIINVQEQENGMAYVELHLGDSCDMGYGVACMESYVEIYNEFATYDYVI